MRKISLLFGDIIILYLALFLTLYARYGHNWGGQLGFHLLPFTIIFTLWTIVFYIANLYEISFTQNNVQFFSDLFYSIAAISVISVLFFYFVPFFGITPKTNFFIFIAIATILQTLWRSYFNRLLVKSGYKNNTLIIGASQQTHELYNFLLSHPQLGYGALGIIDIEDKTAHGIIENLIKQKSVKTVVLDPSVYKIPHIIDAFYGLLGFGINFHNLSDFYERATSRVPLGIIDQTWFLKNITGSPRRFNDSLKRIVDILVSFAGLAVSSLLLPFVVIAIKLDDNGPIFHIQNRIGQHGKIFQLTKFRTMRVGADARWPEKNDPRVTRVGRFLRASRLDEFPQFWNVLRGDLSVVGPRPDLADFAKTLETNISYYKIRNLIKPGITGWAQIHQFAPSSIEETRRRLAYDIFYIKNRSLILDLAIILKTIKILLSKMGK